MREEINIEIKTKSQRDKFHTLRGNEDVVDFATRCMIEGMKVVELRLKKAKKRKKK